MENRWAVGICVGLLTGGIAYTVVVVTTASICLGEEVLLVSATYALPVLALQGGILGLLVSPFVIGYVRIRTEPISLPRVGPAATVGAGVALSMALLVIALIAWITDSLSELLSVEGLGILATLSLVSVVGSVVGGVIALRELQVRRAIARLRTGVQMWDSHEDARRRLRDTPNPHAVCSISGIAEPGAIPRQPSDPSE